MEQSELNDWVDAYIQAERDPKPLSASDHPLWWAVERSMAHPTSVTTDEMWAFILAVLAKEPPVEVVQILAAGPLEDLLASSGPQVIERVEIEARRSPHFRHLLGGVWRNQCPPEVWARVERARVLAW